MAFELQQFILDNSDQVLGTTDAGQQILLGGLSGLFFEKEEEGKQYFVAVPDRGPNGAPTDVDGDGDNERPFALPDYQARIVQLVFEPVVGTVEVGNTILLTREDGVTPITGLPNLQADEPGLAYTDEDPVDLNGNLLANDPFGADLESIVIAPNGDYWMSDEYRPAIYQFDSDGVLINRFIPEGTAAANGDPEGTYGTETLPPIYAQRRANRGFEGMALDTDNGKLYAWIQSPIDNPDVANNANSRASQILRILEVDPSNGEATGEFIHVLNDTDLAVDKIGDAVYKGDGKFLAIERDSAVGPEADKFIFEVDITNATNILGTPLSEATESQALELKTEEEIRAINSLSLNSLGSFETGEEGGAEIAAYDSGSQRLFVTNGANDRIDVIDISDPTNPTEVTTIDLSPFGGGVNSVAVKDGIVVAAVEAEIVTDNGSVVFFDVDGNLIDEVEVGALPDMVTFTPDGSKILVANEGEPNEDYTIDPEGSISIIDISNGVANATVNTADFTAFNNQEEALKAAGVRIFGLNASVAQDVEPEYIAVSPDGSTAFVTLQENNAAAVVDIENATITDIVPLGFKDHSLPGNGLDASDRDGAINIQNWPIFGMYQPDSIASFQVGADTYYITANEGDARLRPTDDGVFPAPNDEEGDIFNEEARIKDVILDPTAFPNAAELQADENIGRLNITTTLGDTDGDGDFDELYSYGSRSFSIWNSQGELVFDSGDDLEQLTALELPSFFNSDDGSTDEFDGRSDNKGPEPEGVTVGTIGDRTYAFIGLERIGGVMTYDITDPENPKFVDYENTTPSENISPEGLVFISAEDSPIGTPLLVTTNEVSGNTVIYEVNEQSGVNPVEKTLVLDIVEEGYQAGDKPEGLALLPDGNIAILNDNDFGLADEPIPGDGSVPLNPDPTPIVLGIFEETDLPQVVSGTPDDDKFDAVFSEDFKGDEQILFTGSGNDQVNLSYAEGDNTVTTSSGDDTLFAWTGDRLEAGHGEDKIFLGAGGGGNRVTGGADADTFYLTQDDDLLPGSANIIGDFNPSEGDQLGFLATRLEFGSTELNFRQDGANTIIEAFGQDVAILNGVNAQSLTEENFMFA